MVPCRALEHRQLLEQPGEPVGLAGKPQYLRTKTLARERATDDDEIGAKLLFHVRNHTVVRGCRSSQQRHIGQQEPHEPLDAPIVRTEIVAPVRDAMRFVYDEEPEAARHHFTHEPLEIFVAETLGRYQQQINLVGGKALFDLGPVRLVRAVDRLGVHAQPRCCSHLIPHQREERADQQRRPGPAVAQQTRRKEAHDTLTPARSLDNEGLAVAVD